MDYHLKRKILNLFFPNRCPVCREIINADDCFCPECTDRLKIYNDSFETDGSEKACACFEYDENIKPAVFLLKDGVCGNSAHAFGTYLADTVENNGISADIIVPVPLSIKSKRKRGYNQTELIAETVSEKLGIPVCCVVRKIRETAEQKALNGAERMLNLENAFEVSSPETVKGKNILLIDDVCTTGSTFSEITAVLKNSGAGKIFCASVCKAIVKK